MTRVCLDTNVWISGLIKPSGTSSKVVELAMKKRFHVVCSTSILMEMEKNLIFKFGVNARFAKKICFRISQVADVYEPVGSIKLIPNQHADNLILETALMGKAKYLVTGDWQHLLSMRSFHNIKIIPPARFLEILG
ncbi:MAG: putative toxin-antitoxin system toxin component, PIN family [Bdellovibrionales bacterium RIFOXYD1_FULL_53_11]|nr:MAG: putative toxin-antitoxin system toxin component, PIN family [Bdellovibrionales bacterium RIFOXYD1_FULL_53_11]